MDFLQLPAVRRMLAAVKRYRAIGFAFFAATILATLVFTLRQTSTYRSTVVIELRWNPSGQRFPFSDAAELQDGGYWSFDEFRNTQMGIIRSRSVLQRVADVLGHPELTASAIGAAVQVVPVADSRLIQINAFDHDPQRAADIANAVAQVYLDIGVENRVRWVQQVVDWLRSRIEGTQADIAQTERELWEFQKKNRSINLQKDKSQLEIEIDALHNRYVEAQTERLRLEGRVAEMRAVVARGGRDLMRLAEALGGEEAESIGIKLAEREAERAGLEAVYGPTHPRMVSVQNQIDELRRQLRELGTSAVARAEQNLRLVQAEEDKIADAIRRKVDVALERSPTWLEYQDLVDKNAGRRQIYDLLLQRFKELDITRDLNREQAVIIEQAIPAEAPFKPNVRLNLALGLVMAFGGGIALTLLWNAFQQTVQNGEDIDVSIGVRPLVELPLIRTERPEDRIENLMAREPDSPLAEAFRFIRNHVLFSPQRRGLRTLLFTGAHPSEGKTTVANNVAIAAAQVGRRVLLIDGDWRRHSLSTLWGLDGERGFADVLDGRLRWQDVIRVSSVPNLSLLCAGGEVSEVREMVHKETLERVIPGMRQEFDLIVIDGTPLMLVADMVVLASIADETFLVVEAGRIRKRDLRELTAKLQQIGASRYEIVLNKVTVPSGALGPDSYGYGYGERQRAGESSVAGVPQRVPG